MSIIESAKLYVKDLMRNNDPSHDWYHVERVYMNSIYITEQEKLFDKNLDFDFEIIQLTALFHDIVDFKYDYDKTKDLAELARERLQKFFSKFNYPQDKFDKILFNILNISWRKELESVGNDINKIDKNIPIELKIVRDSDRLESIGAIGIARLFSYSGAKNEILHDESIKPKINLTFEEYNQKTRQNQGTSINFFYEKLILIKDRMQTETGKRLAQQRHQFMLDFLKQFEIEFKLS